MSTLMDLALWKVPALVSRFTRDPVEGVQGNTARRVVKRATDATVTVKGWYPVTVRNDMPERYRVQYAD